MALPAEHGGWGFVFEPLLLGHLVASSRVGWWLVLIALGTFLMRQPLKITLMDLRRGRWYRRTNLALRFVGIYALIALVGLIGIFISHDFRVLIPLGVALPFMVVQLVYDVRSDSRALLPELAGAGALGGYATAIALAGGWAASMALALWIIVVARAIPSILYVRARLLLEKGKPASGVPAMIAHGAALIVLIILTIAGFSPWLVVAAAGILLVRAGHGVSRFRRPTKATTLGFREIVFGLMVVVLAAVGYQFHL